MDEVKVIQVIYCTKHRRGDGTSENDPVRIIPEIFTLEGEKIMENDSERKFTRQDLKDFWDLIVMKELSIKTSDQAIKEFMDIHSLDQR